MFPSLNKTMISLFFKNSHIFGIALLFVVNNHGSAKKKIKSEDNTAIEDIDQEVKENHQDQRELNDHKWRIS